MKLAMRWQRILILALLLCSFVAPILYISRNISYFASNREFLEEISGKDSVNGQLQIDASKQGTGKSLEEVTQILYDGEDYNSLVGGNSSQDGFTLDDNDTAEQEEDLWERNGIENVDNVEDQVNTEAVPHRKEEQHELSTGGKPNGESQSLKAVDVKVRELREQLTRARVYLSFKSLTRRSRLVKELKLRIKELEQAAGSASKDSDLSPRTLQQMESMELTLSKARRVYSACSSLESKLYAMALDAEGKVRKMKNEVNRLIHLSGRAFTKGQHCLSLHLTTEYYSLQPELQEFPSREKLHQPDLHHFVIFSDNVLACAVVVNSTISTTKEAEKIVFHVVTDPLNLPALRMWFLVNPPGQASISIVSVDDFKWLPSNYHPIDQENTHDPRYISRLNDLQFYLPQIFPALDKIVLLDHDIVVQRDLRGLWNVDMKGKAVGAVEISDGIESSDWVDSFANFSDPTFRTMFNVGSRAWAFGMNVFDLREWKRQDLTGVYHRWLKFVWRKRRHLWKPESFPLALMTFYNQTVALNHNWHVLGLGNDYGVELDKVKKAAVVHYSGPRKPWMEIGISKYRGYWTRFIDFDHPYLQLCNIHK